MKLRESLFLMLSLAVAALIAGTVGGYALAQAKDRIIQAQEKEQAIQAQEKDRIILAQEKAQVIQAQEKERVIQIKAKRFEYTPNTITVKKGVPVVLEFTSLDRLHGFNCSELGIRTDIPPKKMTQVRFVPQKVGTFPFICDIFCGTHHADMSGTITVTE
ncbi:MAG: cupredoxin domain-containing protein [Deltaproteobacteria bacterium]|nr:cupredoxin domain-containing protein [Deltaproteobacteria bacterium]